MNGNPRRKFTVMDALLLIAAVAVGLAWLRHYQGSEAGFESYPEWEDGPSERILGALGLHGLRVAAWWTVCFYHVVAPVTLAVLLARLRKPRPRLRRLVRQPGTVGCAAVMLAALVELVSNVPGAVHSAWLGHPWSEYSETAHYSPLIGNLAYWDLDEARPGLAIAVAWLLLAASGRWRREPDWVDRAGFALAVFWIAAPILVELVRPYAVLCSYGARLLFGQ